MKKRNHIFKYQNQMCSDGTLSLVISVPKNSTKQEKINALSHVLASITLRMMDKGFLKLLTPTNLAFRYGNSRQYWEKLLRTGKIPYKTTPSGKITTNIWVDEYLNKKDDPEYYDKVKTLRKLIIQREENNFNEKVICPNCQEEFQYNYNQGLSINGVCRNCNFKIYTQK